MPDTKDFDKPIRVKNLLTHYTEKKPDNFWPWMSDLDGKCADKKRANKFLLGCMLDHRKKTETVWRDVRKFAEETKDDPDDLWQVIANTAEGEWKSAKREYSLHWRIATHNKIWRMANRIVKRYDGDARNIWRGESPSIVVKNLKRIGMGPEISRMTVGALIDTGQIKVRAA